MTEQAAFQATYSNWRLVQGRKVVQIVLEVPVEAADEAYQVLGGMPDPSKSVWCAVARMDGDGTASPAGGEVVTPAGGDLPARPNSKRLVQQAAICCSEPMFQKFLGANSEHEATLIVRSRCEVDSRSKIIPGTPAGELWDRMYSRFSIWKAAL